MSVLITVTLLVMLSWSGRWLASPAPRPPANTPAPAPAPPGLRLPLAERVAQARDRISRGGRDLLSRVMATHPRTRQRVLLVLAGGASLALLGYGVVAVRRRRNDRRPTPATNLGHWTSRTGLARDAARFLIARQHRNPLPVSGSDPTPAAPSGNG